MDHGISLLSEILIRNLGFGHCLAGHMRDCYQKCLKSESDVPFAFGRFNDFILADEL
jgi:hypothetical protein